VMPLVGLVFAIGLYPAPLFNVLRPAVTGLMKQLR
jgi:NADH:ubiquinone oxidoreductase subunit 4 (subunit M)